MSTPRRAPPPVRLPVHPHQLEVQEFDSYALIVDLRPAADFARDHVPGAVSLPWARSGSFVRTGPSSRPARGADPRPVPPDRLAAHRFAAPEPLTVEEPLDACPYGLAPLLAGLAPGDAVLLVDGRGGRDSLDLAVPLRSRGMDVDVMPGGFGNYRRWVVAGLDILARALDMVWVRSAPGGAAQAVVSAAAEHGVQSLALADLLGQQRLPGLSMAGDAGDAAGLTQEAFESALVDRLRRLDPGRAVWVDECLLYAGAVMLPGPLRDRLRQAPSLRVDLPMAQRPAVLQALRSLDGSGLVAWLHTLPAFVPNGRETAMRRARSLAMQGQVVEALQHFVQQVLDPLYAEVAPPARTAEVLLRVDSAEPVTVWSALQRLPAPWPSRLQPDPDQMTP